MAWGSINCGVCKTNNIVQKTVSNNFLNSLCKSCGYTYKISLIEIVKKIIYLDQNIFSDAYALFKKRGDRSSFKRIVEKLHKLANKQLLLCPYSDMHDLESHQRINDGKDLFALIQAMSRGKQFYLKSKIKEQQIINAYIAFLNNKDLNKYELRLSDAIEPSVHDWDPSFRVQVTFSLSQIIPPAITKKEKELFAEQFLKALPYFNKTKSKISENFKSEVTSHAQFLMQNFMQVINSGNQEKILNSAEVRIIHTLMNIDRENQDTLSKFKQVNLFLESSYFEKIPYVHISSGIWAMKRKEISSGSCPVNLEKQRKQIRGFAYDIEHAAVFAPYCDAMLTEIQMAKYLKRWHEQPESLYPFNVYSIEDEVSFHDYLDSIENDMTQEMKDELHIVYGDAH